MNYSIAIPSYKRASTLRQKTLALLQKYKIDPERVTIFVANDEEYRDYQAALAGNPYKRLVVGTVGVGAIRNIIHRHYSENTYLVSLDDDLQRIFRKVDSKRLCEVFSLEREVIGPGFRACEKTGTRLWGIYAAGNPFFMRHRVTVGLYFVISSLYGCINCHDRLVSLDDKQDYERSILYYLADGAVCRLDNVTVKSAYYKEPGGMQVERTEQRIYDNAKYLTQRYPNLCSMYIRRTTGRAELRLKDKR